MIDIADLGVSIYCLLLSFDTFKIMESKLECVLQPVCVYLLLFHHRGMCLNKPCIPHNYMYRPMG